jgi:large subunit ribosomal protein L3
MGKRPGSGGFIRRGGKVIKGKRFPGHMGAVQRVMRNLEVIQLASATHTVFLKGSIPGKARSLVFIEKSA